MEGEDMKIIRIGKPQTLEKYEDDIRGLSKYHIRKSRSRDTADTIIETFKEGLNRVDKLNGIVVDDNNKTIGFFTSKLDAAFFAGIDSNEPQPVVFIEHLYCPNSYIEPVYKGIRRTFREKTGAKNLFIFTHRNPEAWIRFSEKYDVQFEIYGYILVDRIKEDK
jgi:hypothetical protein